MTISPTEIQKKHCIFNLLNGCVSNIFHREQQTVFAVLSSKLFVPLPPRPLPSNHHPGGLQHLLIRLGEKLLLLQRHPHPQPVLGHLWTRGTLYHIEQPGSVTRLARHFPTRFARAFSRWLLCIADNLESWKEIFYSNPVYVVSMSGPVFLAVDTFLLLG